MHPALLIDEILEIILDKCLDWPDFEYFSAVAQLAKCCKAWKDPALDRAWKNLAKVDPLLNLVQESGESQGNGSEEECASLPQDHRFHAYSNRVKSLILQDRAPLLRVDRKFILPRVTSITLVQEGCKTPSEWIASPSLKDLRISIGSLRDTPSAVARADALAHTIERIAENADSSLTNLRIRGFMTPQLNAAISTLTTLRSLSIYAGKSLDAGLLASVASMPFLKNVSIHAAHIGAEQFRNAVHHSNNHYFPHLATLEVRGQASLIQAMLEVLQQDTVEVLKLEAQTPSEPSAWKAILETVASKASLSLRDLTLQYTIDIEDIDQDASHLRADDIPFTTDSLRPLATLSRLRRLEIDSTIPPTLTDRDIEQVASWWPHLEDLDFGTIPDICDIARIWQPCMTTAGLIPLARNCSQLQSLTLPLDLTNVDDVLTKGKDSKPITHLALRKLSFGHITEMEAIAPFIRKVVGIFPNVESIDCTTIDGSHPVDVKNSIYGEEDRNAGTADGLVDGQ